MFLGVVTPRHARRGLPLRTTKTATEADLDHEQ